MTRPTCAQCRSRENHFYGNAAKYADGGKRSTGPLSPEAPSGRALPLVLIHSGGRPQVFLQAAALILLDGTLCGDFGLWTSAGSTGADVQTVGLHHFVISPGATDPPHAGETVEETRHVRPFFRFRVLAGRIRTFLFWFAQKLFRGGKWQTSTTRSTWPPPSGCSKIRPAPRNTQVPKTWRRPDKTW